jgi:hypothetical protein
MSTEGAPNANQPRSLSALGWGQWVLALAKMAVAAVLVIAAGAGVGYAIIGKIYGGVAGGGIAFVAVAAVFQRRVLCEGVLEIGCTAVAFAIVIAALAFVIMVVERKLEAAASHSGRTHGSRSLTGTRAFGAASGVSLSSRPWALTDA